MTVLWHFYWPVFAAALILGLIAGVVDFRKPRGQRRHLTLLAAGLSTALIAVVWHGPGGAANRLTAKVERDALITLRNYEMDRVTARLKRRPLRRTLVLSGPADDFQQRELLRIMNQVPGVQSVEWDRPLEPYRGL